MDETLEKLGSDIAGALAGSVAGFAVAHGELTITASANDIVKVVTFLRDDERCQFWSFVDITAIDWPGREYSIANWSSLRQGRLPSGSPSVL